MNDSQFLQLPLPCACKFYAQTCKCMPASPLQALCRHMNGCWPLLCSCRHMNGCWPLLCSCRHMNGCWPLLCSCRHMNGCWPLLCSCRLVTNEFLIANVCLLSQRPTSGLCWFLLALQRVCWPSPAADSYEPKTECPVPSSDLSWYNQTHVEAPAWMMNSTDFLTKFTFIYFTRNILITEVSSYFN